MTAIREFSAAFATEIAFSRREMFLRGVEGDGPVAEGSDGVVSYKSAHLDNALSELVVRSSHSVEDKPEAIEEVRRILREHLGQP